MNLILAKVCSFITNVLSHELTEGEADLGKFNWVYNITDVINAIKWPLIIIIAAAGSIYAIFLGVQMARADSSEKREEAKKRVINVLLGVAIAVGLMLLITVFVNALPSWIGKPEDNVIKNS